MVNGQVAVTFDGIDLDDCINKGLEFTGFAKCTHCDQIYYYQIHVSKKVQSLCYPETRVAGELNGYDIYIDFSGNNKNMSELEGEPAGSLMEGECVPCNGCTPNCPKKGR